MESRICLDIETVENENAPKWWANVEVKAPSNYKDQEKIDKYIADARMKLGGKSALTWHTGKVLSFATCGVADDTDPFFFWSIDEAEVLKKLIEAVGTREVYTKSGKLFDFPFLVGRLMANNIEIPTFLRQKSLMKDVDDFFSWSQSNSQRLSLDAYAHGLGIAGKSGDFKVINYLYGAALMGEDTTELEAKAKEYNIRDVLIVRELVRRYSGVL